MRKKYLDDLETVTGSRSKPRNIIIRIWFWLSRRWLINIVLGIIAVIPFILCETDVLTVNENLKMGFIIMSIFGVVFVNLGSIGFATRIVTRIWIWFKYR